MMTKVVFHSGFSRTLPNATMLEWLVNPGDSIVQGQEICCYEIDKAVSSFAAPASGYVRTILVKPGAHFAEGELLAWLSDSRDEEPPPAPAAPAVDETAFDWSEIDEIGSQPEPLDPMRKTIARRMVMSKSHIPAFYLTTIVDMSGCIELRAELKKRKEKATFNDMAIKAAALALIKYPHVAGVFVPTGFLPRDNLNIGFAAALPDDGLVVPVVKQADKKPLVEIARETRELAAKAKLGQLTPEDCCGGVFSVSYLGSFEVDEFIAIVNPGEAAIMAVSKIKETPVAIKGELAIRPMMKITFSFDHRSIDGALGARFASEVKKILGNPEILLQ